MRITFFVTMLALGTAFTACKKDNNNNDGQQPGKLPAGQYRLVEMHRADSTGLDSTGVRFLNSTLNLSFDAAGRSAKLAGKADAVNINGAYKVEATNLLKNAKIATSKITGTENDLAAINILESGQKFEEKGIKVIIHSKDKGYLVFSMEK